MIKLLEKTVFRLIECIVAFDNLTFLAATKCNKFLGINKWASWLGVVKWYGTCLVKSDAKQIKMVQVTSFQVTRILLLWFKLHSCGYIIHEKNVISSRFRGRYWTSIVVEFSLEKSFDKDTTTKEKRCLQVMQLKCPEFPTTFITHSMYHIRRLYSRFSFQRTFQESVLIINLPSAMKRSSHVWVAIKSSN